MHKKVFVFDLDFTLWNAGGTWCDATNPPYSWKDGRLLDSLGNWIRLYPDVEEILQFLLKKNKKIVAASRTHKPDWAKELLRLFKIDAYFDLKEIYPADKTKHFQNIRDHFQVPYTEMVFFDDEHRNILAAEELGVESVYVENGIKRSAVFPFI